MLISSMCTGEKAEGGGVGTIYCSPSEGRSDRMEIKWETNLEKYVFFIFAFIMLQ